MLGLVWTKADIDALTRMAAEKEAREDDAEPVPLPDVVRYPLSLLVRPELLDTLTGGGLPDQESLSGMMHVPKGTLSLANVSKEEFLKRVGAAPATSIDLAGEDRDPFRKTEQASFRNRR